MGFFGNLFKSIGSIFTKDPLGILGTVTSMSMGIGSKKRQKDLMDYQDQINDENYQRERQDKLADYERQLADQKAMVADERQYNSIGSQMQRARNANISPLAALGVSSGNTLSSVSPISPTSSGSVSPTSNDSVGHMSNALTLATTLKQLKQRDKEIALQEKKINQENRESETRSILNELEAKYYGAEVIAKINKLLAEGDTEGARRVLIEAQTDAQKQETEHKGEMHEYNKRESESRTKLNNAHANKASFEDWYQRTHHRSMSNGMNHLIDTLSDCLWSGQPGADVRTDGRDATTRIGEIFDKLKSVAGYFNDESLFEYAKLLFQWFKDEGISFGPTRR